MTVDAKGSDGAFSLRVPIAKLDEDQHLAFGVVATVEDADGQPIIDHQGDIISVAELERAAYDYVLTSGDAGLMHESSGVGTLVESFVVTKAKREAYGFGPGPTFWHVGYKVHSEDVWKRLKSGEVRELSLEGSAFRDETKVDGTVVEAAMAELAAKNAEPAMKADEPKHEDKAGRLFSTSSSFSSFSSSPVRVVAWKAP